MALGGLLQGMVANRQLRIQLQREAQQQQAAQQEMSARDIQTRMLLAEHGRPVSDAGTVTLPGTPGTGLNIGGTEIPTEGAPAYTRKADQSRTVAYGGQRTELYTPEEEDQRQASRARTIQQGTGVLVSPSAMGIPGVPDYYADPAHIGQSMFSPWLGYMRNTLDPRQAATMGLLPGQAPSGGGAPKPETTTGTPAGGGAFDALPDLSAPVSSKDSSDSMLGRSDTQPRLPLGGSAGGDLAAEQSGYKSDADGCREPEQSDASGHRGSGGNRPERPRSER